NTVCSEGDNWRNQIRSSVRISVVGNDGLGYCSGTLINNTLEDCTPYILSAEHCTEGGVTASEFNQWVFLFNYSSSTCAGTTGPTNQFVSGCKKVSESNDNNGDAGSDFLLLRLNTLPPSAYNVYYSGWDHSNTAATSGVGIHHPEGDITKISTFTHTATSQSWGDTVPNTHWQITWSNTSNGWGVSEPGSSGSAMYNQNGFVVGHLTGGNSCCTLNGCGIGSSPFGLDLFGKLAFDWASNGVTPEYQLGPWLDPENTGATTLSGMDPPCGGSIQYDAGMQAISLPGAEICGTTFNPVITIRNFGSNILTTIVISYFVDNGAIQQQQWTGTLNPGNTINVTLGQLTLSTGVHTIAVSTSLPNNHADNNTNNDLQILNFTVYPGTGNVNLFFSTDNKGSQSTWQITDGSNNIVASGGPFVDATGGRQYNYPLCLPSGCYKFTVFDSNSDGMHNGEDGDFSLTGPGGTPVYFSLGTPAFGAQEEHNFCIDATGINEVTPVEFSVTPNPSTGLFAIAFNTGESKTLKVFDAIGRLVNEKQFSGTNYQLNLSGQSKGVYLVAITSPRGTSVKKLVLE
ncbi:MAG TPA: T9SS type A sorting domain-containing protein, partial [Chitinophagales bacterium]|nr:T9SS type A sorting domain-containing protein [Chitinophagales bacterium]